MEAEEDSVSSFTDDLIAGHVGLARSLASRFTGRGEPFDDLQGVAHVALVGAAHRYDPHRDVAFATFATVSIVGELKRHFRDRTWLVRAPRRLHDLVMEVSHARECLTQDLGRPPRVGDLANHLRCSEEDVLMAMEAGEGHRTVSLQAPKGYDGCTLIDTLGADDPGFAAGLDRVDLEKAMTVLDDEDRYLIDAYFIRSRSQTAIADELGCNQMRISRRLSRALGRLRHQMAVVSEVSPR